MILRPVLVAKLLGIHGDHVCTVRDLCEFLRVYFCGRVR